MLGFLGRFLGPVPGWAAIVGVAVLLVGAIGIGGYVLVASKPHVTVGSSAQRCAAQPTKVASLFSDGQTTMIRLSSGRRFTGCSPERLEVLLPPHPDEDG